MHQLSIVRGSEQQGPRPRAPLDVEEAVRSTPEFMQLHVDHWPEWVGECEVRELEFQGP